MGEEVAANLRLWDGWTDIHMAGPFYDVEGFIEDPGSRPFDQVTRGVLGDLTGKRVLHLQSHIGIDTIALALMGAVDVMGVDFSPQAVGQSELRVRYPYFSTEPLYFEERGSYADRSAEFVADSYVWQHPLAEVMGALLAAGLEIGQFSEYPVVAWQVLEFMEQGDDGLWHLPPGAGGLPLMFSLSAIKPSNERVESR